MIAQLEADEWVEYPLAGAMWIYRKGSDPVLVICPPWLAERTLDCASDEPIAPWVREMMSRARQGDYRVEEW